MTVTNNDTIAAISTPIGEGGIGIVRVSGPRAIHVAENVFAPSNGSGIAKSPSHKVHYGYVTRDGEAIDEALVTVMRAPKTYTAEDVVEINCHGGTISLKKVLDVCLAAGARLAAPGEFTRRAFINGKMDLSQAEAVLDIINSETSIAQKVAVGQLRGELSKELRELRHEIVNVLAFIELAIDFSQQDVEFPEIGKMMSKLEKVYKDMKAIVATSDRGMILKHGASVVICGRPNVGKSSLMNALLRHDRVIVTPIAGTTRDVIEEHINIAGVKVRVTDTAGIIETTDRVELEGIKRSKEKLEEADIVLFVLDASSDLSQKDREIFERISDKEKILVLNKTDLKTQTNKDKVKEVFLGEEVLEASALKKEGLNEIEDLIAEKLFKGHAAMPAGPVVTNMRHKEALDKALECIERGFEDAKGDFNGELIAADLKEAAHQIGLITGHSVEDDILDRIFSQFCIGK